MIANLLISLKIKLYPFFHQFICSYNGYLDVLIPTPEYTKETGDNEAYMLCPVCNKKYHLCYLEPENEES